MCNKAPSTSYCLFFSCFFSPQKEVSLSRQPSKNNQKSLVLIKIVCAFSHPLYNRLQYVVCSAVVFNIKAIKRMHFLIFTDLHSFQVFLTHRVSNTSSFIIKLVSPTHLHSLILFLEENYLPTQIK